MVGKAPASTLERFAPPAAYVWQNGVRLGFELGADLIAWKKPRGTSTEPTAISTGNALPPPRNSETEAAAAAGTFTGYSEQMGNASTKSERNKAKVIRLPHRLIGEAVLFLNGVLIGYALPPNEPSSTTAVTKRTDCNRDGPLPPTAAQVAESK